VENKLFVPEAGEKYFKSLRKPCNLTFLSTHPLSIHIKSKLIQCESTANMTPFKLTSNIGNPEMSDITRNE